LELCIIFFLQLAAYFHLLSSSLSSSKEKEKEKNLASTTPSSHRWNSIAIFEQQVAMIHHLYQQFSYLLFSTDNVTNMTNNNNSNSTIDLCSILYQSLSQTLTQCLTIYFWKCKQQLPSQLPSEQQQPYQRKQSNYWVMKFLILVYSIKQIKQNHLQHLFQQISIAYEFVDFIRAEVSENYHL
jgi:hypothetical protein